MFFLIDITMTTTTTLMMMIMKTMIMITTTTTATTATMMMMMIDKEDHYMRGSENVHLEGHMTLIAVDKQIDLSLIHISEPTRRA